jgi:arylsulfatase A-like enzyme
MNLRLSILLVLLLVSPAVADQRPNIVMIFVDDMGYGDLSCFGNPDIKTPHIDRLASQGLRLTQFYTNSPICSPSRVAVTTGQYPGRHSIHSFLSTRKSNREHRMRDWLDPGARCIARAFRDAGYQTAHFGKWHMGGGRDVGDAPLPQAYGFDESLVAFEGLGDRVLLTGKHKNSRALGRGRIIDAQKHQKTEIYVDRCIDFITRHKDRPFYLHLWLNDVHAGYFPSAAAKGRVEHLDVHPFLKELYAVMDEMDRQIGRLVETIDGLGLADKTLIILTSDNGPNLPKSNSDFPKPMSRTGSFRGEKWSLYEGGIRMPFIARWPGHVPKNQTDQVTVMASIDFFPTFCALAGIEIADADFDGEDRSSALLGSPLERRFEPIYWEYGRQNVKFLRPKFKENVSPNLALREGNWKLLLNEDGTQPELYEFSKTTDERQNLAEQHPEITKRMTDKLLTWYGSLPTSKSFSTGIVK